jgi:murein DD-endopeptidase MepM/ murein hydrolase activator NlpD
MHQKISFVVLTHSGSPAKQFCTSRAFLRGALAALLLVAAGAAVAGYDYYQLKRAAVQLKQREDEIARLLASQRDETDLQQKQIGEFAREINALKDKLLVLNQFEKKIRVMTDVDKRAESAPLFGVGGSPPGAIDPKAVLSDRRNSVLREMHSQVQQLNLAAVNQDDGFKGLITHLEKQQRLLASTPTIRPVDPDAESWETSKFDWRTSPFTNQREFHKGYDVAAREGTTIYATAGGVVTFAGNKGQYGKTIIIDHGLGISTVYGHCSKIFKLQGEKVSRWDAIALVGNTGSSTGPHLHYEVHLHGVPVNPEKYILN